MAQEREFSQSAEEEKREKERLINSVPGGVASFRMEGGRFIPVFFSDGVSALSGHTREEIKAVWGDDIFQEIIYGPDRKRVAAAMKAALASGEILDISFRVIHKSGELIWVHLNGQRADLDSGEARFDAVFIGISEETRLFQSIANETADGIYVIAKANYDLLYSNESKTLFRRPEERSGQKCYEFLLGKTEPCSFCTFQEAGEAQTVPFEIGGRYYSIRSRETSWNGTPAWVKYVRDVTEEICVQKEKERLEQYFQTVIKNLPGGVAVVRYEKDGSMQPEFLSDGFAAMTGMTMEEAWELYSGDAMAGVHPSDMQHVKEEMDRFVASGENQCEIIYRLKKGDGSYLWVKNTLTVIQSEGGENKVYAGYHDMTREMEERELLRRQYNDLIIQHYRTPGPNALIVGHCNVTRNKILEILDYTDSGLLQSFGTEREEFFRGLSGLVQGEEERQEFLDAFLNEPTLAAYNRNETELVRDFFIRLPREKQGRYVQFKVNLVETPDSGDITGILTVSDTTEQMISGLILNQLSVASYDLVVDLDLNEDCYTVLSCKKESGSIPKQQGKHSQRVYHLLKEQILPKDREHTARMLDKQYMVRKLEEEGSYSFSYAVAGDNGKIFTKNLTICPIDLRIGRVCLARADITDSVREQQGLLNVIAYTFELLALIDAEQNRMTLYTRETVLENLSPFVVENYNNYLDRLADFYDSGEGGEQIAEKFSLEAMKKQLEEKPSGYDFVLPCVSDGKLRYKQINVLWGDRSHKTVCMVRADVTDMLSAERETKKALVAALKQAEEANRAKSEFLSSMSHDIRTPLNAVMGMTALATAHLDSRERVENCLKKISLSSRHLLSLVNDILDMSKIERSGIPLNRMEIYLPELMEQISAIMLPQARAGGLEFIIRTEGVRRLHFYGDALRINQILINILGNAVKFTPEGGRVIFSAEEILPARKEGYVRYCFTVSDTGIGMPEELLDRVFDPFVRSRSATRVEGTGLGLSITKGLVDLMGGEISVESAVGSGTVFRVELECEEAPETRKEDGQRVEAEREYAGKKLDGRHFLVAEDNAINAEILCELLEMNGAEVTLRMDGEKALNAFSETAPGTFDAVLMDIQMPVMNGYEACRAIRGLQRPDAAEIPVIAMTANAFAEDIQASLEAGMNGHVAKPIDLPVLWSTLNSILIKPADS